MYKMSKVIAACGLAAFMGFSFAGHAKKGGPHLVVDKFKKMDVDNNNRLSPEEHFNGAVRMFSESDLNRDGTLTAEELDAHKTEKAKKRGKAAHDQHQFSARDKIAKLDSNGDGVVTKQEHDDGARKMFTKMDTDKDGFLTLQESQAAHERMLNEKPMRQ